MCVGGGGGGGGLGGGYSEIPEMILLCCDLPQGTRCATPRDPCLTKGLKCIGVMVPRGKILGYFQASWTLIFSTTVH